MSEFEFGQRVVFTKPMTRRQVPRKEVTVWENWGLPGPQEVTKVINREWQPNEHKDAQAGMIIGKRTLSDGYSEYEEWGYQYSRGVSFTAYLIATDMYAKPVLVRPENITAVPSGS